MPLRVSCRCYYWLYFVFSVFVYIDCNSRGKASRPFAGTQIQTSCDFHKNSYKHNCYLDCVHFWFNRVSLESSYLRMVRLYRYGTVSNRLQFFLEKIFITLRHRRYQVHAQHIPGNPCHLNPINIARYKKAVSSALWFQLTLVACYLPYIITGAFLTERGLTPSGFIANEFALTLLYANSSLNPIFYCWKIREVRQVVKDTIRQLFCQSTLILT